MANFIVLDNLRKSFGNIVAVNGISMTVDKGDILGFIGPNGSGKSTTMKMATGFLTPDMGTSHICGISMNKHPKEAKCITISYDKKNHLFLGINTFGIRMRHKVFDKWLSEKKSIEFIMEHLADANFDPEFYKLHETAIVAKFNTEFNTNITLRKKSWKRIFSK